MKKFLMFLVVVGLVAAAVKFLLDEA